MLYRAEVQVTMNNRGALNAARAQNVLFAVLEHLRTKSQKVLVPGDMTYPEDPNSPDLAAGIMFESPDLMQAQIVLQEAVDIGTDLHGKQSAIVNALLLRD